MHDEPTSTPQHRRWVAVKGHPGIYRKGERYMVRWRHHGRLKARSFRNLTEAKRFKNQTGAGDTAPSSRVPFKAYAGEWIDTYTGRTSKGVSDTTRASYRDALERLAVPYFGTVPLDRIDPPMLRDYIKHLAKRGLAAASVRRAYAPVRALLATAVGDGLLKTNPASDVRVIVADNRPRKPMRLTVEQTRALLEAMPDDHHDLAFLLAMSGLRISEALGARWEHFGPGATLRVPRETTKTAAGERVLPLDEQVMRMLTKRRTAARYNADSDPIFPSSAGTPLDPHNWRRQVFRPAAVRAGVPWATPHKLRHGVASWMAENGYSAAQIAAQLGHADGGVLAMRVYVHPTMHDAPQVVLEGLR